MSNEPSPRAQFNVWVLMTLVTAGFAMYLTWWGLNAGKLEFGAALGAWMGPITAGGAAWVFGKAK